MNAFDYIQELKDTINNKRQNDTNTNISIEQHYNEILNILDILKIELEQVEYNYELETIDCNIRTFDEYTVTEKQLNENVILFQPLTIDEFDLSEIDLQSLTSILQKLKDKDLIKEDIIIIPPNINIFRAKLVK